MLDFNKLLQKYALAKEIKEAENPIELKVCPQYIGLINKFLMDKKLTLKEKELLNQHLASCPDCRMYTYKTKVNMPHIPKKIPKALKEHIKKINEELFAKYSSLNKNDKEELLLAAATEKAHKYPEQKILKDTKEFKLSIRKEQDLLVLYLYTGIKNPSIETEFNRKKGKSIDSINNNYKIILDKYKKGTYKLKVKINKKIVYNEKISV